MKKEIKKEEKVKKESKVKKEKVEELKTHAEITNATIFELLELNNTLRSKYLDLEKDFKEFRDNQWKENKAIYNDIQSAKESIKNYVSDTESIVTTLHDITDDIKKDVNEKHSYQNERLTKQAQANRLKIEQIKHEFQKVHEKNKELESYVHGAHKRIGALNDDCENLAERFEYNCVIIGDVIANKAKLRKEVARMEFILLGFIGLNFGLTIFLLVNFFTVFDF